MARRRSNGEGSIYQRESDGLWLGVITLGYNVDPKTGKRTPVRKTVSGKTQAIARQKLTKLQHDRDRGLTIHVGRKSVAEFLLWWLDEYVEPPSRRASTAKSYRALVTSHIIPHIGHIQLTKLSIEDVQGMLNAKRDELSPRTVQYIRGVLRSALNEAMRLDRVSRNVAALTRPPASVRYEITPLDIDQAKRFLEQVTGDRMEALYRVAIALGLRKGEALGLRWQDIDLDNGTLNVRHSLTYVQGTPSLAEPKSAKSRRTITIPPELVGHIRRHRVRQLEERMIAGTRWADLDLVFSSASGTALDQSKLSRELRAHLVNAKLPPIRFHDLRHTAATLLVAEGVHPRTVMEILGHSGIAITMNTYAHVLQPTMKDATDKIGRLLMGDEEANKWSS